MNRFTNIRRHAAGSYLPASAMALLIGLIPELSLAQGVEDDPFVGVWVLDLDRSYFASGQPPRSQVRHYEPYDGGLKATVTTVNALGQEYVSSYEAAFDGVTYPLLGAGQADGIQLRRTGARSAMAILSHAGREVGEVKREVSLSGTEMTMEILVRGDLSSRWFYRRQ